MTTYATATPLLLSMVSRAVHFGLDRVQIVMEYIDGHLVMCVGHRVYRNGLDGMQQTAMIRWKVDGKHVTRREVYERFGARETT